MAQTGFTPILIYSSSTAAAAPAAGSLTNSTLGSELAINITDGKLFYKDNANAVQVIGWKVVPTTAGGTGLTSYAQGDLLYYNSGTTLIALAKNTTATRYLSNTGTNNNPAWAQVDLTNGVTGRLPYANLAQGSALSVLGVTGNATADVASIAAGTDNQVLRRSGTSVGFGAIALNQSAAVTGTLATGNGGTGLTSFTANGVVYASSTSALATGSAITFDGTNFATTGTASATKFIPTGGTATGNGLYLPASDVVGISTGGTERTRFTAQGYVKASANGSYLGSTSTSHEFIGTATSGIQFYVQGAMSTSPDNVRTSVMEVSSNSSRNYGRIRFSSDNNYFIGGGGWGADWTAGSGVAMTFVVNQSATPATATLSTTGVWTNASDRRYKENVVDLPYGIDELMQLKPSQYNMIGSDKKQIGLIAQDVLPIISEVVESVYCEPLDEDRYTLSYGNLIALCVKAIQQQQEQISNLKTEIAALKDLKG